MSGGDNRAVESREDAARRWRRLLASERDAAALYERLASAETGERREIFLELAQTERRHAAHWANKLSASGQRVPAPGPASLRTRILGRVARRFSTSSVLPLIERAERLDAGMYDDVADAGPEMAGDERQHAATLASLRTGNAVAAGQKPRTSPSDQNGRRVDCPRGGGRSGTLRAAVFGVSDGLVSNTALVMGIAGSGAARSTILLAGIAGLLAGSFSMAAGEYVSMASQRDMYSREISLEEEELREHPEEERDELVLIYRAKGLTRQQAEEVADRVMSNRAIALDTLAREELGLDPDELGSPWKAAASSLLAFAAGASVVVLPYLFLAGAPALIAAITLAVLALTAVGAGTGILNGRSPVIGAARQLVAGVLAAAVTYGAGAALGTTVG